MVDGLLNKKIAFVIQARMQSTRFPGKILMPLPFGGTIPLLGHIVQTLQKSITNHVLILATSTKSENDVLVTFCEEYGVACFRGEEEDVLSRFTSILEKSNYDIIVRLTGDNPLVDIELLDKIIENHILTAADYTATQGLPLGMNFEIVSAVSLKSLTTKNLTNQDKEHVTLFLKNSGLYKLNFVKPLENEAYASLRTTVDYPSDFLVASALFTISLSSGIAPGIQLIDYCLQNHPWIFEANQTNFQKGNYASLAEELKYVKPILEQLEFNKTVSLLDSQTPQK